MEGSESRDVKKKKINKNNNNKKEMNEITILSSKCSMQWRKHHC